MDLFKTIFGESSEGSESEDVEELPSKYCMQTPVVTKKSENFNVSIIEVNNT